MKQLLLYFMFFVVSAIILVQCARFFPSQKKNYSDAPLTHNNNGSTTYIDSKSETNSVDKALSKDVKLRTDNILESSNTSSVAHFWMSKPIKATAAYNPYLTFKSNRVAAIVQSLSN